MADVLDRETIKALSADQRQEIMKLLAKRPHTASEIAKITRKHVTTVTEHLDTLERAQLVRKKDSTNKWVYYALTDKGEHLFKPQFYSWVVVLSLSVVFMFVGFLRLIRLDFSQAAGAQTTYAPTAESLSIAQKAADSAIEGATIAAPFDYLAYVLIILGLIGLVYLAYKRLK